MDTFDNSVRFEQQQFIRQAEIQHGAIVPAAGDHGFIGRQRARQFFDEFKFVHNQANNLFLLEVKRATEIALALKRPCTAKQARRLPVYS